MSTKVNRRTVDLSQYPDLVVVYLGMRVNSLTGLKPLRDVFRKLGQHPIAMGIDLS